MAIQYIVEDGTAKADATSYATIAFFKQYFENQGYPFGTISDSDFEVWGNKSTKTLEGLYMTVWSGARATKEQALSWPRIGAVYIDDCPIDDDVVPIEVQNATAEMVFVLSEGGTIQPIIDTTGDIIATSVAVEDGVSEAIKYSENSDFLDRDRYTAVEDALARLTGGASAINTLFIQRT